MESPWREAPVLQVTLNEEQESQGVLDLCPGSVSWSCVLDLCLGSVSWSCVPLPPQRREGTAEIAQLSWKDPPKAHLEQQLISSWTQQASKHEGLHCLKENNVLVDT